MGNRHRNLNREFMVPTGDTISTDARSMCFDVSTPYRLWRTSEDSGEVLAHLDRTGNQAHSLEPLQLKSLLQKPGQHDKSDRST